MTELALRARREGWRLAPLRTALADVTAGSWGEDPDGTSDDIACVRVTDFNRVTSKVQPGALTTRSLPARDRARLRLRPGDLLIEKSGGVGKMVLFDLPVNAVFTNFLARARMRPEHDPRFFNYLNDALYHAGISIRHVKKTTLANLDLASYLGEWGAFPNHAMQVAIADYLDRETGATDTLVEQKERLLTVLGESVLARAYEALSRGLGRATVRPTGLTWIPTVPSHWTVEPLRARYAVQLGKMLNPSASGGANLAPYLRNVNVQWDRVDVSDLSEMAFDDEERARLSLTPGDLLVCEGGEVGRTAIWRGELEVCYFQKAVHRLRRRGQADVPRYLYYVMRVAASAGAFRAGGNRSTIVHLTKEKLQAHRFPFPPPAEQAEIVQALDRATLEAARLQELLERQISKLRERRAALITAAVTGQLDVAAA